MSYHQGASLSELCIANLMFCHGTQNIVQPFLWSRKLLRLYTLGLNFTMKSWDESLVLMSVIMHSTYLKQTQLLCVIWWYHLWAACSCLSWFTVAMRAFTEVVFAPGFFHADAVL